MPDTSRLHLGCGGRHIPGFFHIDALSYSHVDHVGPVDRLPFISDGSVEMIYASHVLEHFSRTEYLSVLHEWRRVIKPGGILRLSVPDFAACAAMYTEGKLEGGLNDIIGLVVGGQRDQYDYHKMIFDQPSLTKTLHAVGFSSVRCWDWRQTEYAHIDDYSQAYLPHMEKDAGKLMSLNLEGIR